MYDTNMYDQDIINVITTLISEFRRFETIVNRAQCTDILLYNKKVNYFVI